MNTIIDEYFDDGPGGYGDINDSSTWCFAEGTKVLMADRTLKNIEDIEVGDYVLAFDEKNPTTDIFKTCKVINTFKTPNASIVNAGGTTTTLGHPFLSKDGEWVKVRFLKEAIALSQEVMPIETSEIIGNQTVYNLEVETYHTYFVKGSSNDIECFWRVHNGRGGKATMQ